MWIDVLEMVLHSAHGIIIFSYYIKQLVNEIPWASFLLWLFLTKKYQSEW
jgi:hypothetical protein